MDALIAYLAGVAPVFILVFARTIGLIYQAPLFGNQLQVLRGTRAPLAAAMALVIMTVLPHYPTVPTQILSYAILIGTEFLLGAFLGLAANFVFQGIQSAGETVGVQAGLSWASTQNPLIRSNVNPFGNLFNYLGLLTFVMIGGHLYLLDGFVQSFKLVPIGTFVMRPELAHHFFTMGAGVTAIAIQLALPGFVALFLVEMGSGYINRVAQSASSFTQDLMQVVKPVTGMFIVMGMLPNVMSMTRILSEHMIRDLDTFLRLAGPR